MIRAVAPESRFPMNEAVARFNRLFMDNPHAFDEVLEWIASTEYGEVTLRFQGGKFCSAEQKRRTK